MCSHILTNDLSNNCDIVAQKLNFIVGQICKFSKFATTVKKTLFRVYCSSIYCCHLWWSFIKIAFNQCRVLYNSIFRWLLHYRYSLRASVCNQWHGLNGEIMRKLLYGFTIRIEMSFSSTQYNLLKSDIRFVSVLTFTFITKSSYGPLCLK